TRMRPRPSPSVLVTFIRPSSSGVKPRTRVMISSGSMSSRPEMFMRATCSRSISRTSQARKD
ncbi:unnamed protein product, partial [Sphagnum tenellum]